MKAQEALDALHKGDKVRTIFDSEDVYYQMFQGDSIARLVTKSYCSAEIITQMTPEDFLSSVDGIDMVETEI
jgi:hypothetical protein